MQSDLSHPVWVRGLKLTYKGEVGGVGWSHPVWVRGLKHADFCCQFACSLSHPVWVRGLKLCSVLVELDSVTSHPVWVRGLKPQQRDYVVNPLSVAPCMGAWIETQLKGQQIARAYRRTLYGCVD